MSRLRRVLAPGTSSDCFRATNKREMVLVPGGSRAYLWIGNRNTPTYCYGTIEGAGSLKRLAEAILHQVQRVEVKKR